MAARNSAERRNGDGAPGTAPLPPSLQRFAAHQGRHDRLLNVQAILGLVPDAALRSLDDVVADFLASVRRQAVQEDRVLVRDLHQLLIDGEAGERLLAFLLLLLLTH